MGIVYWVVKFRSKTILLAQATTRKTVRCMYVILRKKILSMTFDLGSGYLQTVKLANDLGNSVYTVALATNITR